VSGRYQEGYVQGCRKGREDCGAEIERLRAALRMLIDNVETGSYESTGQAIAEAEKLLSECNMAAAN
jgi:hypothetical protein